MRVASPVADKLRLKKRVEAEKHPFLPLRDRSLTLSIKNYTKIDTKAPSPCPISLVFWILFHKSYPWLKHSTLLDDFGQKIKLRKQYEIHLTNLGFVFLPDPILCPFHVSKPEYKLSRIYCFIFSFIHLTIF